MTRKRRKHMDWDPTYRLQIYQFTKLHDSCNNTGGPKPRSGHRIQCTDTYLYSVGGYHPNYINERSSLFREVWRYDFVSRKWLKLESKNIPKELASSSTILSGNLLFLYGGTGVPFGTRLNEALYFCILPKSGTSISFEEIEPITYMRPRALYGHSMALIGNNLYAVGGTTGHTYSMDVHVFNIETREWKKLYDSFNDTDDGPAARYRHEIIHYNDRLYIFGGGTSNLTYSLKDIPAFNLKTKKWEVHKTHRDDEDADGYPASRKCHGCIQDPYLPSIAFVNGGSNGHCAFGDTWRIDLDTLKWTRIDSLNLPHGTYFHSVAATPDGRMVVFGGITDVQMPREDVQIPRERTADLYVAWITVPKLADACWEAVLHYIRNGTFTLPRDIRSFGLPQKYEQRLISSGLVSNRSWQTNISQIF